MPRPVDLVVISDVHLGTSACKAAELNAYLKSIDPGRVVLGGDIIDFWEFKKGWWPTAHTKVVRRLLKFATNGIPVHYITGNHDEALRRYAPFLLGDLRLSDELRLDLDGCPTWFIHGDQVDRRIGTSWLLTRLGTWSYDGMTWLTDRINQLRGHLGLPLIIDPTARFKRTWAAGHITRFERAIAAFANDEGQPAVVCGHIHVAADKTLDGVHYLNSGDWVDSLTALEYRDRRWQVVRYSELVAEGLVEPPASLNDTVPVLGEAAA
jgi:UDP-2,3-diacylglucosamine pyrophosphatase LpxH